MISSKSQTLPYMSNPRPYRQRLGKWGETIAEAFLQGKGLVSIGKNIRTRYGEIDLLMKDGDGLCIC